MITQRRGGTVALKGVEGAIRRVQVGTDKTAAELAMPRLHAELQQLTHAERSLLNQPLPVQQRDSPLLYLGIAVLLFSPLWVWLVEWSTYWERHNPLLRIGLWVAALIIFLFGIWLCFQGHRMRKEYKVQSAESIRRHQDTQARRLSEIRLQAERVRTQIAENRRILDS